MVAGSLGDDGVVFLPTHLDLLLGCFGPKGDGGHGLERRRFGLEENGFLDKRIVSKTPVRAEYFLTKKGFSARRILLALSLFSLEFHPDFEMSEKQNLFVESSLITYFSKL